MLTSEGVKAACQMDRDNVRALVLEYAESRAQYAIERAKDPWCQSNIGCIERAKKASDKCDRLLHEIEEELSKE